MLARMFRHVDISHSLKFGILAGVISCIPAFFYIRSASYEQSWLLYVGAVLFFIVITLHILVFRNKNAGNPSMITAVFASHVTSVIGVFVSMLVIFILLALMIPGFFGPGMAETVQADAPANTVRDKTMGLSFRAFAGTFIANFSFGSFAGIIWPFYMKRNQTRDAKDPAPLHQRGVQ